MRGFHRCQGPRTTTCSAMLKRAEFICPSNPVLRAEPPTGEGWLHEIKFDCYRAQPHKDGDEVTLFSKNGRDFTARFKSIGRALERLSLRRIIIDAEIVACDAERKPDFRALHSGAKEGLCAWCFDLLALDERKLSLIECRKLLAPPVQKTGASSARYSDPVALLTPTVMGLEGVMSSPSTNPA